MVGNSFFRVRWVYIVSSLAACLLLAAPQVSAQAPTPESEQFLPLVGDALVSAGQKEWARTTADLEQLKQLWQNLAAGDSSAEAKAVADAMGAVERSLASGTPDQAEVKQAISRLAKAADVYVTKLHGEDESEKSHEKIKGMLPFLANTVSAVEAGDWEKAKMEFSRFVNGWPQAEGPIRKENFSLYGSIEAKTSLARIALNMEPPSQEKAKAALQDLTKLLEGYVSGQMTAQMPQSAAEGATSISDLLSLLSGAQEDVQAGRAAEAADKMQQFITAWPSAEGVVQAKSPATYTRVENEMTEAQSRLLSNPPDLQKAGMLLSSLQADLAPYASADATSYTAWDAGLILFREGLEAILVIAALLAFLNRTGNSDKRIWIWGGAGGGLAASGGLAFVLTAFLSQAVAGSSRELIEGVTGLISVVFMVTVGAWLHSKSNLRQWNQFIERTLGAVLARGALWSLAMTSFLAVMREGAETIIFYLGMASSIETSQLAMGIGGALLLLFTIGVVMIRLSAKIPVRPFFLVASLLLYYLAFKFVGMSVHALQVTGKLSAHMPGYLLDAPSLGIFPTWETTLPQLVLLAGIGWTVVRTERKNGGQAKTSTSTASV